MSAYPRLQTQLTTSTTKYILRSMKTAVISVKVDQEVKEKAQAVAKDIGLPLGSILNAYLKELIKSQTVYFAAEPMTPKMEKIIEEAERERAEGKTIGPFNNAESAISYLKRHNGDT